ncbi:sulfatase family protein [Flexithrix dorotheae]|uniref:sulfatase family protein n=1 Tax=Flexithrix dorotheae TaxID=70993 RepID=UPI0003803142|nr:arylsulfatase [Flexithrix dorotheae]
MNKLIYFALCMGILSCNSQQQTKNQEETEIQNQRPNIIFILADDMGYGDLKSLNPDSDIPTPNMDKIVNEGIHFTDAHTNSSVCTPTRYGVLTGRYAFRTRLKSGVLWGYSPSLIESGRVTVAGFLKQNGYNTACVGKWHLGLDWQKLDESKEIEDIKVVPEGFDDNVNYSQPAGGGPQDCGFDYSLIIPASLDMSPYLYVRNGLAVEPPTAYTEGKDQKKDGRGVFWRKGKMSPGFDFFQVLPSLVDSACNYISQQADEKDPFFLYLPLPAPHTPWMPTDEFGSKSNAGKYGDFVNMVDAQIGKVMQAVTAAGMDDNTLIIVTSDNGADWNPDDKEKFSHRANYIFKGRKADIFEAGHRVLFIARWKGKIQAGSSSDEVLCTTDLLGTVAGLLEKPIPNGAGEDSYNLWPAFVGNAGETPIREATIHHSLQGIFSIRKGKWKFTPHLGSGGFSKPSTIEPKEGEAPGTLYDMENDPEEQNNLYDLHPEIVKELTALIEKYKEQGYSRPL